MTSSPLYPRSNGQAERTVQTLKKLLTESDDLYLALLNYRSTPLPWCNLSPAELLMGRQLRTTLPLVDDQLKPKWPYLSEFEKRNSEFKSKQKEDHDRRHGVRERRDIPDGTDVWVTSGTDPLPSTVTSPASAPRSYVVNTPGGELWQNHHHLTVMPSSATPPTDDGAAPADSTPATAESSRSPIQTRSHTGTAIIPPDRY